MIKSAAKYTPSVNKAVLVVTVVERGVPDGDGIHMEQPIGGARSYIH